MPHLLDALCDSYASLNSGTKRRQAPDQPRRWERESPHVLHMIYVGVQIALQSREDTLWSHAVPRTVPSKRCKNWGRNWCSRGPSESGRFPRKRRSRTRPHPALRCRPPSVKFKAATDGSLACSQTHIPSVCTVCTMCVQQREVLQKEERDPAPLVSPAFRLTFLSKLRPM